MMNEQIIKVIRKETMATTDNNVRWDFIGLSTDAKPTPTNSKQVTDGSTYYEADTSKLYFWTNDTWYEKTSLVQTNIERHLKW